MGVATEKEMTSTQGLGALSSRCVEAQGGRGAWGERGRAGGRWSA